MKFIKMLMYRRKILQKSMLLLVITVLLLLLMLLVNPKISFLIPSKTIKLLKN